MTLKRTFSAAAIMIFVVFASSVQSDEPGQQVKETALEAPHKIKLKIRMEGPYTADVPLQVVCYFKYTPEGVKRMSGAPVELDKRLGGVIGSLRERGEFVGDQLETILILPPENSIKAKALLIVGLGEEDALSLKLMEAVGRVSLREAARLGVGRVAFAPLIRDQGNSKLGTGDVESAVVRGVLLAYETEKQLQQKRLSKPFTLDEWIVEAGPAYFDETVTGVQQAIADANAAAAKRPPNPSTGNK